MEKIIVSIVGLGAIAFVVWWFFGKHSVSQKTAETSHDGTQTVTVMVDGGFSPQVVTLQKDVPATIVFHRNDPSACLSHVVMPDFGVNQELPLHHDFPITVDTTTPGEYTYACGMNMFFGKVVIT